MKLTLTVHDERTTREYDYSTPKTQEYVRTEASLEGNGRLVADTLRAIANEIDPQADRAAKPSITGIY